MEVVDGAQTAPKAAVSCPTSDKPFVKEFVKSSTEINESSNIPCHDYDYTVDSEATVPIIPVIDYDLLLSSSPDDRKKVIYEIGKACQDWGFFMLVNHRIAESLTEEVIEVSNKFFELSEEEKRQYETKRMLDPITCGTTSFSNASKDQVFIRRHFLKVFVHPDFHSPAKPESFRDLIMEYTGRIRNVTRKLLGGISESLGLEEDYIEKTLKLDNGLQIFAVKNYPPCPQPESPVVGLPPHTDHGLLTLVVQNGVDGLEIQHHGKWVHVNALPNSILVNTCDHLEIFSNGKYKSVTHRVVLNNSKTRISLAMPYGPSLDTTVSPTLILLERDRSASAYNAINYRDYLEQEYNAIDYRYYLEQQHLPKYRAKSSLERSKITQQE